MTSPVPGRPASPAGSGVAAISTVYAAESARAGGTWCSIISAPGDEPIVEDRPDQVVHGYSIQKIALAAAVLDKIDRGDLALGHRVTLTADDVIGGSGIYHLQTIWDDTVTVAGFLTAMLLVSDNTAVRLCARVAPPTEINATLAAKGFTRTRVEPAGDRFFLGVTTPRETTDLLTRLATGDLLSPASTTFMLSILRSAGGYHDGVRRTMSSVDRHRVATKHGADFDTTGAARHEAGIVFAPDGRPRLTYAMFARALPDHDNYGATHPAVEAHAAIGRTMLGHLPPAPAGPGTA
ncbi:serine hydrolase [Actinoplanes sp. RD1]|uniref:serine hydrolase n=1 Tax=Actinoplanes sp. RD1 TaxID=3064538 RepID=UPI0027429BF4|nr:serine hydrolase [Actinoplanes sp. RD1]